MLTVLIADDEPHLRLLIAATLAASDCRLLQAADGDEAWTLLSTAHPDVAVLDVMMPGKTGLELVRLIRDDQALAHMRVILLTAKDQPEDAKAGRQAGANLYLTKPFSPLGLLNAVTCDFAMAASDHDAPPEPGGLHVQAAGAAGEDRHHWRPALTVHVEPPTATPEAPPKPPLTAPASAPHWPHEFVDEGRLWEVLGYASAAALADPNVARRVALLERRIAQASSKGRIKRFIARGPTSGSVVARGYRREDIRQLFEQARSHAPDRR